MGKVRWLGVCEEMQRLVIRLRFERWAARSALHPQQISCLLLRLILAKPLWEERMAQSNEDAWYWEEEMT